MSLAEAIRREATKLIQRHQRYAANLEEECRRVHKRSAVRPKKTVKIPSYWAVDPGFNPYHVRAHADQIAYGIQKALAHKRYQPRPAVIFDVPKDDGGVRHVSVFQVADNAVSRLVLKQLLAKNSSRLSAYCYAYRTDLTLHDAVLDIASELKGRQRLFVAEFDFRQYFDSISHDHIEAILRNRRFFVTDTEHAVMRAFLRAPSLEQSQYSKTALAERGRGIPQGTSVSLFIANIAAQPLDKRLERLGVGFARFADDTLIWSDDYSLVCRAATALEDAANDMGVHINLPKSSGVSVLVPEGAPAEFKRKPAIEFLGYRISAESISIRERSVRKFKEWISYIIYSNLLKEPKRNNLVASRVAPTIDRDYVVAIFQIRRYLYGDLNEADLRRHLARDKHRLHYQGLMSFYPIVDDEKLLKALDGWLLRTLHSTLKKRAKLFSASGIAVPEPHGKSSEQLKRFIGKSSSGDALDLRVPSFARMSKLLRRASAIHGANAVANPQTLYGIRTSKSVNRGYGPII